MLPIMLDRYAAYLNLPPDTLLKLLSSAAVLLFLWLFKYLVGWVARRRVTDTARLYHWRRITSYTCTLVALFLIGRIWIRGIDSIATFLGLFSAGLAIALHDSIANLAGWVFIVARQPFKVGDRVQIGDTTGDVIDIRLFQFSMVEVGNWVDADQSTGRIIHVPNNRAIREITSNYETGFEYVWHEIPVRITFESNWREAKTILEKVAEEQAGHLSEGVEEQIRRAAMRYLIYFKYLSPAVYTTVRENGVLLTIRYIVKPRHRRDSEQAIWEAVLTEFAPHEDISLAYPTTRFYTKDGA
jgi:small-conductance mechanosensitive channel